MLLQVQKCLCPIFLNWFYNETQCLKAKLTGYHTTSVCLPTSANRIFGIKRKKKKKKLLTAQVEPGPSDSHNSTISTWPTQLPVISHCTFNEIKHHNCTTRVQFHAKCCSSNLRNVYLVFVLTDFRTKPTVGKLN